MQEAAWCCGLSNAGPAYPCGLCLCPLAWQAALMPWPLCRQQQQRGASRANSVSNMPFTQSGSQFTEAGGPETLGEFSQDNFSLGGGNFDFKSQVRCWSLLVLTCAGALTSLLHASLASQECSAHSVPSLHNKGSVAVQDTEPFHEQSFFTQQQYPASQTQVRMHPGCAWEKAAPAACWCRDADLAFPRSNAHNCGLKICSSLSCCSWHMHHVKTACLLCRRHRMRDEHS